VVPDAYVTVYKHWRSCDDYLLPMTSKTRRLFILPISGGNDDRLLFRNDKTLSRLHLLICTVRTSVSHAQVQRSEFDFWSNAAV